jgi:hypothetical protein
VRPHAWSEYTVLDAANLFLARLNEGGDSLVQLKLDLPSLTQPQSIHLMKMSLQYYFRCEQFLEYLSYSCSTLQLLLKDGFRLC